MYTNTSLLSVCQCNSHSDCNFKSDFCMKFIPNITAMEMRRHIHNKSKDINCNFNGIKHKKSLEARREDVMAIKQKFPTKIPLIVTRYAKESNLPQLDKSKFLIPQEITMSQFVTIIRNRMQLSPTQALYLLVNNRSMLSLSATLAEVYRDYVAPDGFLYVTYASQEVFGSCAKIK